MQSGLLKFDQTVPTNGYHWWYLDGFSDDGQIGVVVILFIGSVFSPRYYRARQKGQGDPQNFCAVNVAFYGRKKYWVMTEKPKAALAQSPDSLVLGRSRMEQRDDGFIISIDERTAPFGSSIRGVIRISPGPMNDHSFILDSSEQHQWQPIAPACRLALDFEQPNLQFEGHGYLDRNFGKRALESDFESWNWNRSNSKTPIISYVTKEWNGSGKALQLEFRQDGSCVMQEQDPAFDLERTLWRVHRTVRTPVAPQRVVTLEDTPFYSRSKLDVNHAGQNMIFMHESLCMKRFKKEWVRFLLPFRIRKES